MLIILTLLVADYRKLIIAYRTPIFETIKIRNLIELFCPYFYGMLRTSIGRLRVTGYLEGISFLILLGICMPLKYIYDVPDATRAVGMIHGLLFVLYVYFLSEVRTLFKWDNKTTILSFIAAFLPFGTFVADVKIFKHYGG